ncbi:PREDICTED: uncharacterized protein LOC109486606 isoform X3 [Branchiostoma belcheri]|uniref:Uncharacterized protein LOC109486606 isoform X3 n=1 Tax=Branchiostoma belcheri TaxID=7741 RepID=A0A6P5ASH6_BRABE|nr:PREDICTED: uncharacterized protein LOC109486606 isoform X3 [Branchiostoma belcheri]
MDEKVFLAPPTKVCLLCSSVQPLTQSEDDSDRGSGTVLYFTKKGQVTRRRVCLYCRGCQARYNYTDYGSDERGYRLYATPRDAAGLLGACAVERTLINPLLFDDRSDREKSWVGFARAYNSAYNLTRDKALTTDVLQAAILEAELEQYYREAGRLQLRYKSLEVEIDQLMGIDSVNSRELRRAPDTPDTLPSDAGPATKGSDIMSEGSLSTVETAALAAESKENGRHQNNGRGAKRFPIGPEAFHCHAIRPENPEEENRKAFRKLAIATCLSLFFVVMELIEVVGSLTSIIIVWIVTGVLVYCATMRLVKGAYHIHGNIMLVTAVMGVIVNTILGYVLHEQAHAGHGHGHSHGNTSHGDRELPDGFHNPDDLWERVRAFFGFPSDPFKAPSKSILVRAAFIHVLGDFLQSLGVLLAACIIYVRPAWKVVDPICTYVFSVLVLITTISVMRDLLIAIMQGFPRQLDFGEVAETLGRVNGVVQVHDLHVWILCDHHFVLTSHIVKDPSADPQQVMREATAQVNLEYDIQHVTLQVEDFHPIMKTCENCRLPPS